MTGMVIRDFFAAFRWQKMKETYKNKGWWGYVYSLTCAPLVLGIYKDIRMFTIYFVLIIPLLFTFMVSELQSMKLPKIMYLCPMNSEERKEYIMKSCLFRIAVPVIVDILAVVLLLLLKFCNPIMAVGILLGKLLFTVVLCSGVNENGYGRLNEKGNRVIDIDTREHVLETWLFVVEVLMFGFSYGIMAEGFDNRLFAKCISTGVPVLIELPLAIAYLRNWKTAINRTMNYER